MPDYLHFQGFENWWASLPRDTTKRLDKDQTRRAFLAGCRHGSDRTSKTYRFQAGRWRVTVNATDIKSAKTEAIKKLDRRASKLGATPPPNGWQLMQIASGTGDAQ